MASEIRVNKINSRTGVGTITLSPTGVDFTGITTVATLSVTGTTTLNGNLDLQDDDKILIGTGDDLEIYHDGSNSYIDDTGTGRLNIRGNTGVSLRNYSDNEQFINCYTNGTVELFHDNSKKFETTTDGVSITGEVVATGLGQFKGGEGSSAYLYIYADEGDDNADKFRIQVGDGGPFTIQNFTSGSWETNIECNGNGNVELYNDNSKKFETKSDGVVVTGGIYLDGSGGTASANKLDDYEEGTFSPTFTSGLTGDTYSNTGGHYTKIGNFVTFTIRIAGAGTNSGSEQVKIGNLPFTSSSSAREGGAWFNYRHDLDTGGAPFMHISQDDDDIKWYGSGGSSWVGSDGAGLNNKTFHVQGFYYTDS